MRPNESGTTRVSMSRTIASLNDLRIFVTRSSADSITFDTIRKRSKPCFIPFFKMDVELFMRTYIESADQGLKQIAVACGFGSTDSMRRAFWRSVGTTPHKYRRQDRKSTRLNSSHVAIS